MAGPGGTEIGRVSIRVVPDTDGFRRDLKAAVDEAEAGLEVTIPVNFDVDDANVKAAVDRLDLSRITIPVDIGDGSEIERLRARLDALDASRVVIPVDLDLKDVEQIDARLAALRNRSININVKLNGISQALARLTALDALVKRLDGKTINVKVDVDAAAAMAHLAAIEAAMAGIRETLGGLGGRGGGGGRGATGIASVFDDIGSSVSRATGIMLLVPPVAAAIAVAGAGISEAWGAASTAIVAIPPAIELLGVPIAAVALGLDGIKKAAKSIKPEFDKMKTAVSDTFEQRMLPIFKELTKTFPTLTLGMQGVAGSVSDIAQRLVEMVSSDAGIARLNSLFANVKSALADMNPGIAALVDSFLILGAQRSIFDTLGGAVNTFGLRFRDMVLQVSNSTLPAAMDGLRGTLDALSRGLIDLVHNGIDLFSTAAPGMNDAINSITSFFDKFDWQRLGSDVGGVFSGIAKGIDGISPGTIDAIQGSFDRLSKVFQSQEMQRGIQAIADAVPGAIDAISGLSGEFASMAQDVGPFITALGNAELAVQNFATNSSASFSDLGQKSGVGKGSWISEFLNGINDGINESLGLLPPKFEELGTQSANAAEHGMAKVPEQAAKPLEQTAPAAEKSLSDVPPAITNALTPAAQALATAMSQMPPIVQEGFAGLDAPAAAGMTAITQAVIDGVADMQTSLSAGFGILATTATDGMTGLGTAVTTGFTLMSAAVTTGMTDATLAFATGTAQWQVAIATGMTAVTMTITAQAVNWNTAIATGLTAMQTTITTGFSLLTPAVTTGMDLITVAIATGTANWQVAIAAGMTALATTITTGFSTILVAAAIAGMAAVTLAIATGTANWQVAVTTGMTALQLTLTNGFVLLAAAATAGTLLIQTAVITGFAAIAASVSLSMATLTNTVVLGFSVMAAAVANGMITIQSQFTGGWANIGAGLAAALATCTATVQTGMAQMSAATQQGMQQMTDAVTNGGNQMAAALQSAVSRSVSLLNSAVGQFRSAGANMGQALADGLNSKAGAVEAAAQRLANAAAAAVRAAAGIHSPSRVFTDLGELLGAGLAVGMSNSETKVAQAADSLTGTIIDSVSGVQDALAGDAWAANFNARVNASLATNDTSAAGTPGGKQVTIQTTINNPLPETGSDSVAKVQRRQAAMGIFG